MTKWCEEKREVLACTSSKPPRYKDDQIIFCGKLNNFVQAVIIATYSEPIVPETVNFIFMQTKRTHLIFSILSVCKHNREAGRVPDFCWLLGSRNIQRRHQPMLLWSTVTWSWTRNKSAHGHYVWLPCLCLYLDFCIFLWFAQSYVTSYLKLDLLKVENKQMLETIAFCARCLFCHWLIAFLGFRHTNINVIHCSPGIWKIRESLLRRVLFWKVALWYCPYIREHWAFVLCLDWATQRRGCPKDQELSNSPSSTTWYWILSQPARKEPR